MVIILLRDNRVVVVGGILYVVSRGCRFVILFVDNSSGGPTATGANPEWARRQHNHMTRGATAPLHTSNASSTAVSLVKESRHTLIEVSPLPAIEEEKPVYLHIRNSTL